MTELGDAVKQAELEAGLEKETGLTMHRYVVDPQAFANFCRRYRDRRSFIHEGKLLEYFISEQFLQFKSGEVYVDIAAQDCPFSDYVRNNYGAQAYRQDLYHLDKSEFNIVGDACSLPFTDGQVSKISLHNSIEHFEGDSDMRFMAEAQRVLRTGGLMAITPLYFEATFSEEHEAGWFDERGHKHLWGKGARFARIYDPVQLNWRLLLQGPYAKDGGMKPTIYRALGVPPADPFYFAIFEKQ